jgi:hypothetical protein
MEGDGSLKSRLKALSSTETGNDGLRLYTNTEEL